MEGKKRLFHINLGPSKVTLQQKRKEKKKDPYFQNKFIQIFFLKENYDTRPTKKKTHQTHTARVMSLVIIIILTRTRLTIMICDSKKKKKIQPRQE